MKWQPAHGLVPRAALIAAGSIMLVTFGFALLGRVADIGTLRIPDAAVIDSRSLQFADRADGAIVITQADDGPLVEVLAPGTNGFIRGIMRSLARDRRARNVGPDAPFQLVRHADGRLSLLDPATGGHTELDAFGSTNAQAFAHLLKRDVAKLQEIRP